MEIRCLGPIGVFEAAQSRSLGGPKQRLVLAHLLIRANQVVPVERLIVEVWDDDPPPAARSSLQSYVSHLRRALGAERIESSGQGYALRVTSDEVDLSRFEALVSEGRPLRVTDPAGAAALLHDALELWRGPPFADLSDAASLQPEITRLTELRLAALEDRIGADLDAGSERDVVGELGALTAAHPLRERLWGLLMLALYRSGRQADALGAYERARSLLADELGIDPSDELRSLHERVLKQDPSLRSTASTLKGYQLLERIGEGAFGVVWRATQPGVYREVAIKVARPALANDPAFIRRFEAEAQQVARIEHPHVVPLYDFWREPGGAYLVMRYLRGGNLRMLLDRAGPPDRGSALRIANQIARGLAAAHQLGVVHGDLTPSNVLLDDQTNAYLGDFGVAGAGATPDAPPSTDDLPHLAPERVDGQHPDTRADVYSLGVLLSELLPDADAAVAAVIRRATANAADERQPDGIALLTELQSAVGATALTASPAPHGATVDAIAGPRNPYKGLRAFTESDAGDFFGRTAVVARLLSTVRENGRFLAVVGPSGSGKSSVVRAGLVPALRAGAVEGSRSWFIVQMVPGGRPFDELASALRHVVVDAPDDLADRLADEGFTAVGPLLPDDGDLLVFIDQFEELFTLADDDQRDRFITAMVDSMSAAAGRLRIVVTLRADFYDRPLEHADLGALMQADTHTLLPLAAAELERAITGPAERVGVAVERRLVAKMVADVTDQPGALPLLQYALTELFDSRRDANLTAAAYDDIGGVAGALSRRAEAVFGGLSDDAREAARQLFLQLVTPGEGVEDTRRRALVIEVTTLASADMPTVLTAFGDARLLLFDRDPETRAPTVEVAHEALLREWQRLRAWIDAARDDLRTHRRLLAAAADWAGADHDPSFLAAGSRLDQYETWRRESGLAPTDAERDYLDVSLETRERAIADEAARRERELALERRSVRRLRTLVAVLAVAALVAGGLTIFANNQARRAADQTVRAQDEALRADREARKATARELAAAADVNLDVDPERSMLLAMEAIDTTRDVDGTWLPEAEEALHRAVGASRIALRVPDIGGAVDWSPTGETFVTEGPEDAGIVDIRDATTGESVRSWKGHDVDINDVEFAPDGRTLATTGDDGAVRIWDVSDGELLAEAAADEPVGVWSPSFSEDGGLVAIASDNGGWVRVADAVTGRVVTDLPYDTPLSTAISPDGDRVAIGSESRPEVVVIDARTGEEQFVLGGADLTTEAVAWSPDGRWIAGAHFDSTARIWDAETGAPAFTLFGHTGGVRDVAWADDSSQVVTGSFDGTTRVWQVADGAVQQLHSLTSSDTSSGVGGVAFSPDGQHVLSGNVWIGAVVIFDIGVSGDAEWSNLPTDPQRLTAVAFPGPDRVAVTGRDGVVTVHDANDRSTVLTIDEHAHPGRFVPLLDATPDGSRLAGAVIVAPDLLPDGASAPEPAFAATVWDLATGETAFSVPHDASLRGVSIRGDVLVSSDASGVVKITHDEGRRTTVLREEPDYAADAVALSPDARFVAVTGVHERQVDRRVRIWDVELERVVATLDTDAAALVFTNDGSRLITAPLMDPAIVWDVATWEPVATFSRLSGEVLAVGVAADDSVVASAGSAGTIMLWDPDTGDELLTLTGHRRRVSSIAFSPDGRRLATAGQEDVARVWALALTDLIAMAEDELTRDLTVAECREYLHVDACP